MLPRRHGYEKDLTAIFDNVVLMFRHTEAAVRLCMQALASGDEDTAKLVKPEEKIVDKLERKIQKACLKMLVMQHPLANDFRQLSAALKIITDLERIADQARDIAALTLEIYNLDKKDTDTPILIARMPEMAEIVLQMVMDCTQAYVGKDLDLARTINETDNKVDNLFEITTQNIIKFIQKSPDNAQCGVKYTMIAKYLERIGDHAVNIGRWIEFSQTGKRQKKIKAVIPISH